MPIADQTILSEIQRLTVEGVGDGGATWPSGMWTLVEVLGYLNQRQNRFIAATGLLWTRNLANITTGQNAQPQPADWIATVFVAYRSGAGLFRELPQMSELELDLSVPTWPGSTGAAPRGYYEVEGDTLNTYVVPAPTEVGSGLERYYLALGVALTQTPAVNFSVPDEFVPTIKYGCLAEMFGKVGQAHNPVLAQMCEERWDEGVELGKLMSTEGWFAL